MTGRHERVGQRRLAHAGIAEQHDDLRLAAADPEPGVIQRRKLALAPDQRLGLEPSLAPLRYLSGTCGSGHRAAALAEQVGDPLQIRARLGPELLDEARLETIVDLEGVTAVAHPRPRLHHAAHAILRQRVELEQYLGVLLYRFEVADSASRVHLPHETVADPGHQLGAPLVLPLLELHGARHIEALQELAADGGVGCVEPGHVRMYRVRGEGDRRALHKDVLPADLLLEDRQRLGQRVPRPRRGHARPEQVHQIVTREFPTGLDREADQEGEVFARAEPHLLPCLGEEQGSSQADEMQMRRH